MANVAGAPLGSTGGPRRGKVASTPGPLASKVAVPSGKKPVFASPTVPVRVTGSPANRKPSGTVRDVGGSRSTAVSSGRVGGTKSV